MWTIFHSGFWTAFVVIAGSTGESLRKMMLRVMGTNPAGVMIGGGPGAGDTR